MEAWLEKVMEDGMDEVLDGLGAGSPRVPVGLAVGRVRHERGPGRPKGAGKTLPTSRIEAHLTAGPDPAAPFRAVGICRRSERLLSTARITPGIFMHIRHNERRPFLPPLRT